MLTNRSHLPPVLLTVEVSRNARDWWFYVPATLLTWDNPTTEAYMANLLHTAATSEGLWCRCYEQVGQVGERTLRWDDSTLRETDVEPAGLDDDEGGFAPVRRRRSA